MSRPDFDWKNPDYVSVFRERLKRLETIRAHPEVLPAMRVHYKHHPADFICDWGITLDPKNVERGQPSYVPFVLFPRQREWVEWLIERWKAGEPGITEKTRQMGFSWLSMAFSCTLCLFHDGMTIGVGSRKQEYVDVIGDTKSLMQKAREFMAALPVEFRGGWRREVHAPHMRMLFPESGSLIVGESGDNLGRGNTTSLYFVDEAAFLERPQLVDQALSQTTNGRQDISTPNGMGNPFAQKRHSGNIKVFTFHWRDDPRKDEAWYAKQVRELDPVTVAQEIDINYAASVEGVLIPSAWVQAAIGAHLKLGIEATGSRNSGLDVADEGADRNAFASRKGFLLDYLESWSGKGGDIYRTVVKAFAISDALGGDSFHYDADGLGAGVRGDASNINAARKHEGIRYVYDQPFRGSGAVHDPEGQMVPERLNKDYFANAKAQAWWALRLRFQETHRAVVDGMPIDEERIISIDPKLPELIALTMELSQPTYSINQVGKVVIDKQPEGTKSPNLADAVMIAYQPAGNTLQLWAKLAQ